MTKQIELSQYAPKIFWSLLLGAIIGSAGGFVLAFLFVKNVWCLLGALVGGALGAYQTSRILTSMLGLNEHRLYHEEGITGQWIKLYWFLNSRFLLAIYGLAVGFILIIGLMIYDSFNLPLLEDKAPVIHADIDSDAAYKGDTLRGRIFLIIVEYKGIQLRHYVDRDMFYLISLDKPVQIFYYESRLLHRIQLRSLQPITTLPASGE